MQQGNPGRGAVRSVACAATLAVTLGNVGTAGARAFPTQTRHMKGSVEICDFGAFFVGGVPKCP
jgi:hypothetical protein